MYRGCLRGLRASWGGDTQSSKFVQGSRREGGENAIGSPGPKATPLREITREG